MNSRNPSTPSLPLFSITSSSPLFVCEADRWLSQLTLHLSTLPLSSPSSPSLSSLTVSSLPASVRARLTMQDGSGTPTPNLDGIVEVAEYCLVIIAWSCGLPPSSQLSIPISTLDRVSFALMTGDNRLGKWLVGWRQACEVLAEVKSSIEECFAGSGDCGEIH